MIDPADENSIRRLIAQYCYWLDEGRFADLAALFAAEGTWEAQYGKATGPVEIEQFLRGLVPARPKRRHFVTNTLVDEDDQGALSTSYYLVLRESDGGPIVSVAGVYHDRLVRIGGEWKFSYRRLEPAILGDLGLTR